MEAKFYTAEEVARMFQISKFTVYNLIKRGELKAFKIGNKIRIEEIELEKYKESSQVPLKE
ncbi:MAG: helix-turn-helix domain-containing protein [Bacillota bacterium]|jgi:putative molybdopterin biosynthesis protein|nr:helix-turn-helix domain-containing protein [Bacillota bacterium]MDP4154164.1 helix-turn-helix domain-containing protein [Bacillota bacterium]